MKRSSASILIVAVAAALAIALTGCAQPAPAAPQTTAVATPTPSPTTTAAAVPSVRVQTTCDALTTQALLDQSAGTHLPVSSFAPGASPTNYANERMGVLTCTWSTDDPTTYQGPAVTISVVPGATEAGFQAYRTGEAVGSQDTASAVGPEAYTICQGDPVILCGFHALLPGYGLVGTVRSSTASTDAVRSAVDAMLARSYAVVAALPAPAPVWQPPKPALRGATTCDGLATTAQLSATTGVGTTHVAKSDDGEYSGSIFDIGHQVGSYWCGWVEDGGDTSISIGVLPGGATYLQHLRGSDASAQSGVGQAAFWAPNGALNVVTDSGWLQVSAVAGTNGVAPTKVQLVALAKQVIANLGTS